MTDSDKFSLEGYPTLHGPIARLAEWYYQCGKPQLKSVAYFTAVATCCNICSRFYVFHDTCSSLYFMLIADPGAGKDNAIRLTSDLFREAGLDNFLMPNGDFSSDSGLYSALLRYPQSMCLVDEAGFLLSSLDNDKNSVKASTVPILLKLFSETRSVHRPTSHSLSNKARDELDKLTYFPAFTFAGVTTPDSIKKSLTNPNTWNTGLGQRFVYWCVERAEKRQPMGHYHSPDPELIYSLRRVLIRGNNNEKDDPGLMEAQGEIVGFAPVKPIDEDLLRKGKTMVFCRLEEGSPSAEEFLDDYFDKVYDETTEFIRKNDYVFAGIGNRKAEITCRLSIALSIMSDWDYDLDDPVITRQAFKDAADILEQSAKVISDFMDKQKPFSDRIYTVADEVEIYLNPQFDSGFERVWRTDVVQNVPSYAKCDSRARDNVAQVLTDREINEFQAGKSKTAPKYFMSAKKTTFDSVKLEEFPPRPF